jgi:large subunit ribosomal protein L14
MIQNHTYLNIIDNSGAKNVSCIKVINGYKRRYAKIGDLIMVSIKNLRLKRRSSSKVKKGELFKALIIRTKIKTDSFFGDHFLFLENAAILLNKQNKLVGTRIFGSVPKNFRRTKFLKICFLSLGLIV